MRYRGFNLILQRGGAVIVEGRTPDGRPPLSPSPRGRCKKAVRSLYIGHVWRGGWRWGLAPSVAVSDALGRREPPVRVKPRYSTRHLAAKVLFVVAQRAGLLACMRPLEA